MQGLYVYAIERSKASGSKTSRFINCQHHIASGLISIGDNAKHRKLVLDHMTGITANDSHRRDDIADTAADAIKLALIDKTAMSLGRKTDDTPMICGYKSNEKTTWN